MIDREKMALMFIESACYLDTDFDRTMVGMIRKGLVEFKYPDLFSITDMGRVQHELNVKKGMFDDESE